MTETESKAEGEAFRAFWARYPLQVGMEAALAQWVCVSDQHDLIMKGLEKWRHSRQWNTQNGRFVPKAEKFLNERWWLQEPNCPATVPMGATGELGQAELEAIERLFEGVDSDEA